VTVEEYWTRWLLVLAVAFLAEGLLVYLLVTRPLVRILRDAVATMRDRGPR
jgi:hypothetical protein